jgi:hypothetical protein
MEKIFLIFLIAFGAFAFADESGEVTESDGETSEFWPPDIVPHPHPPGSGPSGPGEPELA